MALYAMLFSKRILCVVKKTTLDCDLWEDFFCSTLCGRFKIDNKLSCIQMDVFVRTFGLNNSAKPSVAFGEGGSVVCVRDRMVGGFSTTCAISAYHQQCCQFKTLSWRDVLDTILCDKVCQWLVTGVWFSPGTPVSSTNKTDRYDITEIAPLSTIFGK